VLGADALDSFAKHPRVLDICGAAIGSKMESGMLIGRWFDSYRTERGLRQRVVAYLGDSVTDRRSPVLAPT
jgi:hypothetical protein